MSDPLFCDPKECNADVHDYARLLQRAARGHVLWEPSTIGQIGDCGQIRDGKFWKFFNVYENPPLGIQRLVPPDLHDFRTSVVENDVVLRSTESVSVSFQGGLPLTAPPATLSINAGFSYDRSEFAFLCFGGRERVNKVLSPPQTESLQRYLILNEKAIRSAVGILSGDIVILHGVTHAPAWMGGLARRSSCAYSSMLSLNVGTVGVDWGVSIAISQEATSLVPLGWTATCAITKGPAGWNNMRTLSTDYTVVVRPIRVKRRQKIVNQLMNLLSSSFMGTDDNFQPVAAMGTSMPDMRLGGQGAPPNKDSESPQEDDILNLDRRYSFSSNSSTDDTETEDDILGIILQRILDENPTIQVITGSWDVISDFFVKHEDDCLDSHVEATFKVDDAQTAFLMELSVPQGSTATAPKHRITTSPVRAPRPLSWGSRRIIRVRDKGPRERDEKSTSASLSKQAGRQADVHTACASCRKRHIMCNVTPPNTSCDCCIAAGLDDCSGSASTAAKEADRGAHDNVAATDRPISDLAVRPPSCETCKRMKISCNFTPGHNSCESCVKHGLSECNPDVHVWKLSLEGIQILPEVQEAS